jgi:CheY-like chemotaxis protein
MVRRYLERAGPAVALAADGPSALATFDADRPDLVVVDLMRPASTAWRSVAGCGPGTATCRW